MSDFSKFIACVVLFAGIWFTMDYRKKRTREFDNHRAQQIVMLKGSMPSEGKPVLLEFWGTYCGPCLQSIPHLNKLHAKYGDKVQFLAVTNEQESTVRAFMSRVAMNYPVGLDPSHEFTKAWDVTGIPTMFFLDANHRQQWTGHAMEMTDAKLASLLK